MKVKVKYSYNYVDPVEESSSTSSSSFQESDVVKEVRDSIKQQKESDSWTSSKEGKGDIFIINR